MGHKLALNYAPKIKIQITIPISAAFSTISGVPPITAAKPAAAILHATPTSPKNKK